MTGLWWLLAVPVALVVDWVAEHWEELLTARETEVLAELTACTRRSMVQCPGCLLWDGDHTFACGGLYDDGISSPWPTDHPSVVQARRPYRPAGAAPPPVSVERDW